MNTTLANLPPLLRSDILLAPAIVTFVYYAYLLSLHLSTAKRLKNPPGPSGIPFFGNEFQIPFDKQWLKFHEWGQKYGDIVRLTTMGQPHIILNSAKAAFDLLEARGTIYSSRPRAVMAGELLGWDRGLGYAPYNERFKAFRRLFHQVLGPRSVHEFHPLQLEAARRLVDNLIKNPEEFDLHARQSAGSTILMISYGYEAQPPNDPMIHIADVAMKGFAKTTEPGAFMVDRFPVLKYLPEWFPGAGFKKLAKQWRADLERLYDVPFEFVKAEMAAHRATPSLTSKYLAAKGPSCSDKDAEFIKAAAASIYSAGVDTTPSAIVSFILAMTLHPEIQIKAQAEVDAVLGQDADGGGPQRLPTFEDRPNMPYVNAVVKEVLRWNPLVPLGLPHELTQDDEYRGYHIPKGSVVWANIWAVTHDPTYFPNPHTFSPERYLEPASPKALLKSLPKASNPSHLSFGFGRHICPGQHRQHLAEDGVFIAIASILACLDVRRVGAKGFLSHPLPSPCDIKPRTVEVVKLVRSSVDVEG